MTKKFLFIKFFWNAKIPHLELRYYGVSIGGFSIGYWTDNLDNYKHYKDYEEFEKEWKEFDEYKRNK